MSAPNPTAAFAVHVFTALGAAMGFGALLAAVQGEFTVMFGLLGIALVVDGVDGWFARRLRVVEVLPRWSGEILDHVVDFLTYVFVPAFALASGAILPSMFAVPAAIAVVISGAIYFADKNMKTGDGYFRGFPVLWNLAAFYLFVLQLDPYIALAVVCLLIVATFLPFHFAHPLRARRWAPLNLLLLAVWGALAVIALYHHLIPPSHYAVALSVIGAYFVLIGLLRTVVPEN